MSTKRYFDNITIKSSSPLVPHLKIQPGDYWGKFDSATGKLLLKKKEKWWRNTGAKCYIRRAIRYTDDGWRNK